MACLFEVLKSAVSHGLKNEALMTAVRTLFYELVDRAQDARLRGVLVSEGSFTNFYVKR
jgi:hypothetical protein